MTLSSGSRLRLLLVVAAMSFNVAGYAVAAAADEPGTTPRGLIDNPARAANVELPDHAMADTGQTGELADDALDARTLRLTLTDGREIEVRLQRVVKDDSAGQQSWVGTVDDMPGSMFVMTRYRGVTTGFLTYGSETWELMPAHNGMHLFYRVDEDKIPTAEPEVVPEDVDFDAGGTYDYGTGGVSADAGGGWVQDLLVVYTPAARQANGQANLEAQIQNAVVAANQAYQNSGVSITLNLVGMREIAYNETSDLLATLYDLSGTSDGQMDSVHSLRQNLGADIVSLVTSSGNYCGIGFAMVNEGSSFASYAFNVVKMSCFSNHSLAHEIGHNQGNRHDRDSASGSGAFPYSHGFRRCASDGTGFRTVMSYSCSGANRVTRFSNPSVTYNGYPTGIAYESDPNNSAENARSMNNTADTVAAFRGSAGGTSGGTTESAPTAPSSLSASADSSTRVTVRWSDNADDETGFRLERSGNGVDFSEIATLGANSTSFSDGSLSARTTYWYRVRAYNSVGNSAYSNTTSVATPDPAAPPPEMPGAVTASNNGDGSARVAWTDTASSETGFEVRRETWDARKSRWGRTTIVASVPAGIESIIDQSGSGTFRYSVRAVNTSGASAYAGPAETTVTGGSKGNGPGKGGNRGGGKN